MVMHLVAALLVALGSAGATPLPASPARLRVVYDGSTLDGTCVLIDVEPRSDQTALSFVTSLRLFKSPEGDPFSPLREVRVTLDDGRVIVVPRDGVVLPMGNLVDVALLRAAVPAGSFTPIPLAWAPPAMEACCCPFSVTCSLSQSKLAVLTVPSPRSSPGCCA